MRFRRSFMSRDEPDLISGFVSFVTSWWVPVRGLRLLRLSCNSPIKNYLQLRLENPWPEKQEVRSEDFIHPFTHSPIDPFTLLPGWRQSRR